MAQLILEILGAQGRKFAVLSVSSSAAGVFKWRKLHLRL